MKTKYYYSFSGNKITSLAAIENGDALYFKYILYGSRVNDIFTIQNQTGSDFLYYSGRTLAPRNVIVDIVKNIPWDEYDK